MEPSLPSPAAFPSPACSLLFAMFLGILAAFAALVQPKVGRGLDKGTMPPRRGMRLGLGVCASGLVLAVVVPPVAGLAVAAVLVGCGVGIVTPLGFTELVRIAPEGGAGATMGAAEVGRELGDAGGPLLVGAVAFASLTGGFLGLGLVLGLAACMAGRPSAERPGGTRLTSMTRGVDPVRRPPGSCRSRARRRGLAPEPQLPGEDHLDLVRPAQVEVVMNGGFEPGPTAEHRGVGDLELADRERPGEPRLAVVDGQGGLGRSGSHRST